MDAAPVFAVQYGKYGFEFWRRALVVVVVANAVALCLAHFFSFRALWLDEAFVADSLRTRALPGLFSVLDNGQLFPRLYLSAIWLLKSWIVYDVAVLRLLPLLFGIGAILLWSRILWTEFSAKHALLAPLAICLFVTNHFIFYYAGELKQYTGDLFWSGYCFWYARAVLTPAIHKKWSAWALASIGWGLPVLVTYTYPFVTFAVGLWFSIPRLRPWSKYMFLRLSVLGGFAALMFALLYRFDLGISTGGNINHYWRDFYITGGSFPEWLNSAWRAVSRVVGRWWVMPATPLLAAIGILGAVISFRKNGFGLARAGGLLFFLVIALAALKVYPAEYGRMQLFFFPYAVALIVTGVAFFIESERAWLKWGGIGLTALLFALTLAWKVPTVSGSNYRPEHWEDINPAIRSLNRSFSDVVVYSQGSKSQVLSHTRLPADIKLIFAAHFIAGQHKDFFKKTYLAHDFYYIQAYPNSEVDEMAREMPSHNVTMVMPHLYQFKLKTPENA